MSSRKQKQSGKPAPAKSDEQPKQPAAETPQENLSPADNDVGDAPSSAEDLSASEAADLDALSGPEPDEPAPESESVSPPAPSSAAEQHQPPQPSAAVPGRHEAQSLAGAQTGEAGRPVFYELVVRRPRAFAGEERPVGYKLAEVALHPGVNLNVLVDCIRDGFVAPRAVDHR